MKIFNINFLKTSNKILDEKKHNQNYDRYDEIGKLVKKARIQNNLSIKELSDISKIPESSINSIEKNIKDLRPKYPFIRSILLKLEKCLSLKKNTLAGLTIAENNIFYFLFLISILFIMNRYFISNINIIEFQIIEEKAN